MSVLKNKTQGNFTMVSNSVVHDTSLCLTDRGLLLTLLSLPDNWHFSIKGLCAILPDGKDKISNALNRLIALGYVTRNQTRNDEGRYGDIDLEVHSSPVQSKNEPQPDNPSADNPLPDNRNAEKPSQYNKVLNPNTNNNRTTTSPPAEDEKISDIDDVTDMLRSLNISREDVSAIFKAAKGNVATIKKAKEALDAQPGHIQSVVGWMISAIKQGYDVPVQKAEKASQVMSLSREYDFEELERKLVNKNRTAGQSAS